MKGVRVLCLLALATKTLAIEEDDKAVEIVEGLMPVEADMINTIEGTSEQRPSIVLEMPKETGFIEAEPSSDGDSAGFDLKGSIDLETRDINTWTPEEFEEFIKTAKRHQVIRKRNDNFDTATKTAGALLSEQALDENFLAPATHKGDRIMARALKAIMDAKFNNYLHGFGDMPSKEKRDDSPPAKEATFITCYDDRNPHPCGHKNLTAEQCIESCGNMPDKGQTRKCVWWNQCRASTVQNHCACKFVIASEDYEWGSNWKAKKLGDEEWGVENEVEKTPQADFDFINKL